MKLKRKWVAVTLVALTMVMFLHATSVSAVTAGDFTDVTSVHPYEEAINYLKDLEVVEGYEDGTYKPENTINRAEFVKIALLSKGVEPGEVVDMPFPDTPLTEWYTVYINEAKKEGWIEGYPDGDFKPERPINFVEAGKVVSIAQELALDESLQDYWFHKYVQTLEDNSAIPPTIGTFDQYINRGEMAEMIWRLKTGQTLDTPVYEDIKELTEEQNLKAINNCLELKTKLEEAGSNYYGYTEFEMVDSAIAPATGSEPKAAEESREGDLGGGADDYSTTNIQVEGVDEADIVKSDGEYIYIVKGVNVRVVKAYPPSEMVEMDEVVFDDPNFYPRDMYVDGDKLVVIGTSYFNYPYPLRDSTEMVSYPYYGGDISKVYILDISDKTDIKEFRTLEFEGFYSQSRKVDEMLYVVLSRYTFWAYPEIEDAEEIIPHYKDTGDEVAVPLCDCADVKYIPALYPNNYLIVVGVPIDDAEAEIAKEVVLGSSDNIYASRENLYVAATDWNYTLAESTENTSVYKFDLGKTDVKFLDKGKVPGYILNQFSMDEYDNHFRIATTKGNAWDGSSANNVYVLDDTMQMVGKVEGIAPGETIYSTRFIGDRLYMVTFKKIDPFFVIDMSDHKFPKILGKLKIPGYSDYLHPYDENHILGFGKETVEPTEWEQQGWGDFDFEWFQGMKVAMFDVTDVENPKQKFKVVIGDRGTESPLMYDHKALLFDRARNLLAFPVTVAELPEEVKDPDLPQNTYGDYVFQGAYVYHVDTTNGFDLLATITHYTPTEVEDKSGYYWYGEKDVERVMYMDDYLYTVSKGMVKANDMTADYEEVNSVEVGGESYDYYPILE